MWDAGPGARKMILEEKTKLAERSSLSEIALGVCPGYFCLHYDRIPGNLRTEINMLGISYNGTLSSDRQLPIMTQTFYLLIMEAWP